MARLKQWCADATEGAREQAGTVYGFVYVDQEGFEKYPPKTFAGLVQAFSEYLSWVIGSLAKVTLLLEYSGNFR